MSEKDLFVKLKEDLHEIVTDKKLLREATSRFLTSLIDQFTLGLIFEVHRKAKTGGFDLTGNDERIESHRACSIETFSKGTNSNPPSCLCVYCNATWGMKTFPTHLLKCMKQKREQINGTEEMICDSNKNQENIDNEDSFTDNEGRENKDDVDWTPGNDSNKKSSSKKRGKNGNQRSRGNSKKKICFNRNNMDIDGDQNLKDSFPNRSNCVSPADSTGSNREKRGKRNRRDQQPYPSKSSQDYLL